VAAEIVHGPAGELSEPGAIGRRVLPVHHSVDFEDLPQPPFADHAKAELDCRVVTVHIAQLHGQAAPAGVIQQLLEWRDRFAARLVQMQVHSRGDAPRGRGHEVADLGFHGHCPQALAVQQLLLGHPLQAAIDRVLLVLLAQRGIGLDNADHFVVLGQFSQRGHLARRVLVLGADLADLDPLVSAGHPLRLPRRDGGSAHAQRSGQQLATFKRTHRNLLFAQDVQSSTILPMCRFNSIKA